MTQIKLLDSSGVKAAERELIAAKVDESTITCLVNDLFQKLTKDDPEIQWDCIVPDMHTKNHGWILGVLSIMVSADGEVSLTTG